MQAYAQRTCESGSAYGGGVYQQQQVPKASYDNGSGYGGGVYQQQQVPKASYDNGSAYGGGVYQQQQMPKASYDNGSGYGAGMYQQQQMSKSSSYNYSNASVFGMDAFCDITPSAFPPGTDPKIVDCFNRIDMNGNGSIDDRELQSVLSNCNHNFSLRTVHLLMYQFTHTNKRVIGPREFVPLMNSLQQWKATFQRFDRDRNGRIDSTELGTALNSLGYRVQPVIVNLLVSKFGKAGARCSLHYDNFIECCLTVKGLTETFNAKANGCGSATFCYDEFLISVLPFIIA